MARFCQKKSHSFECNHRKSCKLIVKNNKKKKTQKCNIKILKNQEKKTKKM
jgi:hypothetical protein